MSQGSVEKFANRESIKGLKRQLERTTDEAQRKTLLALLAEEEAKREQLSNEADPDPDPGNKEKSLVP
jgi:hypothetical protein